MKGVVVSLLLLCAASCFAADCVGSGGPENPHEFFEHPIPGFKEMTGVAREKALAALSGRTLAPLSLKAFKAYAGKSAVRRHRYFVRALAYTDRQNGGFTVYRHADEILVLYTLVGQPGGCEDSVLVIEVDQPLRVGHYGVGAVR
ncbi:hypothetical protein ACQ859_00020 [Roseateles chitinivorans]|uniref:hypothetical protein n=1 Tax=Roseateles chitinivorans TaxID=2917965 RepID=UPI003D669DD4